MDQQNSLQFKPLVVYPSKKSIGFLTAGALMFVVIGILFVTMDSTLDGTFTTIIRYACIVFFGFCLLYALKRLTSRRPSLRINEKGIYDNASAVGAGLVRWEEIKDLPIYTYGGQTYLGIELHDVEAVIRRQPLFKRLTLKLNKSMPGLRTPFNIPAGLVPIPLKEVQRRAASYMDQVSYEKKEQNHL